MKDENRTKEELIKELKILRKERRKNALDDITERKQAEQALKESEEKYRTVFENTGTATMIIEEDRTISMVNTQGEKLSGYSKGEIENKRKWTDFVVPEDLERMKKYHITRRKAGEKSPTEYEFRMIDKKGNAKNVFLKIGMIPNTKKSIASLMDITDRKQVEEELKDSEERLKILFDYAPDAYYIVDLKGKFVNGNKAAERMAGYKKEELIGKNIFKLKLISIRDISKAAKLLAKNIKGLPTGSSEFVLNRKDNRKVIIESSTYPVKIKGRTLVLGIARDITERKQAEKALADSEEKYRIVFENTGTATIIIEENKIISMVNTQSEKMYGYSKEEIENKMKWTDFIIPEDLERMKKYHIARRKAGEKAPTEYEFRLIDKKGSIRDIFLKIGMIPNTKKSIASLMDITERKKAKEELRKSEALLTKTGRMAKVGGWEVDTKTLEVSWTKETYRIHEVLLGNRPSLEEAINFFHPDDRPKLETAIQKALEHGEPYDMEIRFITAKGKHLWTRTICKPIIVDGKIVKLTGTFQDITEHKKAEENMKNIKNELQMILDSVPALIIYKDTEGRIIRANKTFADALKIPVKGIVGKTTEELFPKEQAEKMIKDDKEVIISVKPKRDIIQPYDTPEGTRWAIIDKMPYKDKEGKVTGVIAFAKDITVQRKSEQKLQQTFQRLKKTMDATIDTMSKIIEAKDPYTSDHQHRVCQLAVPLARELGLPEDKIEGIRIASLIHDIGKIGLPTEILSKPGKLTDIEFSLIKDHSQIGHDILKSIDFSYPIEKIVLQHHERLNGSGYPNNLKGDKIFPEAKIIGIADVVEAMSSFRPYRPALGIDAALEEISQNKGILYDPEAVDACIKLFKEKGFKFE